MTTARAAPPLGSVTGDELTLVEALWRLAKAPSLEALASHLAADLPQLTSVSRAALLLAPASGDRDPCNRDVRILPDADDAQAVIECVRHHLPRSWCEAELTAAPRPATSTPAASTPATSTPATSTAATSNLAAPNLVSSTVANSNVAATTAVVAPSPADGAAPARWAVVLFDEGAAAGALALQLPEGLERLSAADEERANLYAVVVAEGVRTALALEQGQRAQTRSDEAQRLRDHILSTVVHDLCNPLAAVKMSANFLQLVNRRLCPMERNERETLEDIHSLTDRMLRMVNTLLDVGRVQEGRQLVLDRQETDLAATLRSALRTFHPDARRDLRLELPASAPGFQVDVDRVCRVVINVVDNALKYSRGDGEVVVRGAATDGGFRLTVEDRGIGIPADEQPLVFDRFFRASNAAEIPGTGIGLATARDIARAHGGELSLTSSEGVGTTFTLWLPRTDPDRLP